MPTKYEIYRVYIIHGSKVMAEVEVDNRQDKHNMPLSSGHERVPKGDIGIEKQRKIQIIAVS